MIKSNAVIIGSTKGGDPRDTPENLQGKYGQIHFSKKLHEYVAKYFVYDKYYDNPDISFLEIS